MTKNLNSSESRFSSVRLGGFMIALGATLLACGGDKRSASAPAAQGEKASAGGQEAAKGAAPAAAPKTIQIKELGVELQAKALGAAEKGIGSDYAVSLDDGTPMGTGIIVTTELASKTFEDALGNAEMYTATSGKIDKKEKTADGWVFRYNNKGELGDNFFVNVVKTVGDKKIECSAMAATVAGADQAEAACLSITAAK